MIAEVEYKDRVGIFPTEYASSIEKRECRNFKIDCLKPYAKSIKNLLTLSADSFEFEEMIALNSRFSKLAVIDSYEMNEEVYKKGLPKYKQLRKQHQIINYKRGNIFDVDFNPYDVLDIDLCGSFTIELMNEIVYAFQRFDSGFVFLTMRRDVRNSKMVDYIKEYGAKTLQEFRDKKFATYLKNLCGLEQYVKPYHYKNKSVNPYAKEMIVYVFTKNISKTNWGGAKARLKKVELKLAS